MNWFTEALSDLDHLTEVEYRTPKKRLYYVATVEVATDVKGFEKTFYCKTKLEAYERVYRYLNSIPIRKDEEINRIVINETDREGNKFETIC